MFWLPSRNLVLKSKNNAIPYASKYAIVPCITLYTGCRQLVCSISSVQNNYQLFQQIKQKIITGYGYQDRPVKY